MAAAPVLTEVSFSKQTPHKLQTGHACVTFTYVLLPAGLSVSLHGLHTLVPLPYPLEKKLLRLDRVKAGNVWWWSVSTSWHGCAPPVVTDSSVWERRGRRQAAGCDLRNTTHRQSRHWILPLKTTSELWLSQLVSRPNALVIILIMVVIDRKKRKKTW